jgi:hypothetical protein
LYATFFRLNNTRRPLTGPLVLMALAGALLLAACGTKEAAPGTADAYLPATAALPPAETALTVEAPAPRFGVFNGCGVAGLAARAARELEEAGYDDVLLDNYRDAATGRQDFNLPKTEIRYADAAFRPAAEAAAELFGVEAGKVTPGEVDPRVDVALILGADFDRTALVVKTAGESSGDDFDWSTSPVAVKMGPPPRTLDDGIYVSKGNHTVTLFRDGAILLQYPCATGRDGSTPEGTFTVNMKLVDPVWYWKGKAIPPGPDNGLGSRFIGITNEEHPKGYGLHGTNEPGSIGRDASHGCVRMLNENVEKLFDEVKSGDTLVVGP